MTYSLDYESFDEKPMSGTMKSDERPTLAIAAGGTGGHMFPAQALAQEMARRGWRIVLVTDARGARYAQTFPADERIEIGAATFAGKGVFGRISALFSIFSGVMNAVGILNRIQPSVVAGFGGYPSLPTMAAALLRGVPRVLHEQNAVLGRVNRLIAPRAHAVATAFESTARVPGGARARCAFVGNPVRDAVTDAADAPFAAPKSNEPLRLLIFGGSQGATLFSKAAPKAIAMLPERLRDRLRIVHQAREADMEEAAETYRAAGLSVVNPDTLKEMDAELFRSYDKGAYAPDVEMFPFFADLPQRIAAAHLVVARAGASTVTELALIGRPSLLVPLGIAMDDHQTANAKALADRCAATILAEADLTPERLAAHLERLLEDPDRLSDMAAAAKGAARVGAAGHLADLVEQAAAQKRSAARAEA